MSRELIEFGEQRSGAKGERERKGVGGVGDDVGAPAGMKMMSLPSGAHEGLIH